MLFVEDIEDEFPTDIKDTSPGCEYRNFFLSGTKRRKGSDTYRQ